VWSRSAGQIFLDWLAPKPGLSWVDVGCGNSAFTELLFERCAGRNREIILPRRSVNAGVKMHRLAGVKVHHG